MAESRDNKKVLVATLNDPSRSPRPRRVIDLCIKKGYAVDVLSQPPSKTFEKVNYISIPPAGTSKWSGHYRKLRRYIFLVLQSIFPGSKLKEYLIGLAHGLIDPFNKLRNNQYDLLIVEDLDILPFTVRYRNNARIMLDAREYYPRQRENSLLFKWIQAPYRTAFCEKYLKSCDQVITVSPGLAAEYERCFGVRPRLVRSVPVRHEITISPTVEGRIRMVHHGGANKNRQLENMIEIFSHLREEFTLDLYLTGSQIVISQLKSKVGNHPGIRILPPVKFEDIIPALSNYDIGFYYLEPIGFNLKHSLPNKLFEFIQARLAVAIGPSVDMAQVVRQYGCGFVSEEFTIESMSNTLNNLSVEDINEARQNSDVASRKLCFENEKKVLERIIDRLI